MANEYIGYQAATPLDWGKLTSGLVKTVQGIGAEREAERLALDKLQSDNSKILQNAELGKSQNFNQLILSGSNDGRDAMMQWNRQLKAGEISPVEYRNRINNLMDSWSTFANTAKTYDQQMQEALKRQNADENGFIPGSGLELELNERMSQLGDLRDKKTQVDLNNGNFVIGQLDQNGLFDPTSIRDTRSLANPGNITDNRVNLSKIVDEGTKGWEEWTIESGATTITDALQNPAIQRARLNLADGILSNPRAMASVLKDNTDGDYDFYANEKELNSKLQDRIAKENELNKQLGKPALSGDALNKFIESQQNKFILLSQDDQGVYQPNLTENQIKQAKQTALDAIDARLGRKVEIDEPYRGGGGGGSKEEKNKKETKPTTLATKVFNAWRDNDANALSQASGGKLVFKYVKPSGVNIYDGDPNDKDTKLLNPGGPIQGVNELATYFYGRDKVEQWMKEMRKLRESGGSQSGRTSSDPLGLGI